MTDPSSTLSPPPAPASQVCRELNQLRTAQLQWQRRHYQERLACIGRIAGLLAESGEQVAGAVYRPAATVGEIMASEVLPLAEACRYTARSGPQILKPRKLSQRDRAWWMGSIAVTELREALGVVLIIGPSNYPLFLPGVQLIQALAAGNAVLVKPAPGCEEAMQALIGLCIRAGVPAELMRQLDVDPQRASEAISAGVDKVLFTGSVTTGRKVAALCTEHMTPMAMELSGNDVVLVADDADLTRVARCVAYALSLNGGQTCIAPRRLLATERTISQLIPLLNEQLKEVPSRTISQRGSQFAKYLICKAFEDGAAIACGSSENFDEPDRVKPIVLRDVTCDMSVTQEDIFAPLLSLIAVADMDEAVQFAGRSPYALGAAVFGKSPELYGLVEKLSVGCVTVNDVLVPTADPRVSFGGRRASGFGVTRGLEGLRELTQLKVICQRGGRWLPHLTTASKQLGPMLAGILKMRHGQTWSQRFAGMKSLMKVGKEK